jgi:hypothetical protein
MFLQIKPIAVQAVSKVITKRTTIATKRSLSLVFSLSAVALVSAVLSPCGPETVVGTPPGGLETYLILWLSIF